MSTYHYALVLSGKSIDDCFKPENKFTNFDDMELAISKEIFETPGKLIRLKEYEVLFLLRKYPNEPYPVYTMVDNPKINNDWVNAVSVDVIFVWRVEE